MNLFQIGYFPKEISYNLNINLYFEDSKELSSYTKLLYRTFSYIYLETST